MLIVLFIVSLLAVVALRALPGEDQRPRETSRMLNVYISSAKNQAASTGSPVGVILRPSALATYVNYSTLAEQCEVPPTYSGDMISLTQSYSKLLAQDWTMVPNTGTPPPALVPYCLDGRPVIKLLIPKFEFAEKLIRYGDQIQINGQGPIYTVCWDDGNNGLYSSPPPRVGGAGTLVVAKDPRGIQPPGPPWPLLSVMESGKQWPQDYNFPNTLDKNGDPDPNGYITCLETPPANVTYRAPENEWIENYCVTCYLDQRNQLPLPWPKPYTMPNSFFGPIPPFSFTITRQAEKSAAATLQMPGGAGIDYFASGVDNGTLLCYPDPSQPASTPAPIVIMFSPGGSVDSFHIGGNRFKPTQTIHLLIGKLTVNSEVDNNWFDLKNVIVSINPQTGTISTNPVYPPYYNTQNLPPYPLDPPIAKYPNQFNPANPPKLDITKPLTDPANANFVQALFYSRKFAREAQTMGGKR